MIKLIIYLLKRYFHGPKNQKIIPTIIELYQMYICGSFVINTEIIKVKKGKARYTVIYTHINSSSTKFTLSRHSKRLEGIII